MSDFLKPVGAKGRHGAHLRLDLPRGCLQLPAIDAFAVRIRILPPLPPLGECEPRVHRLLAGERRQGMKL